MHNDNVTLEFKPDFAVTRSFWRSFWRGENKRPALRMTIPRPGESSLPSPKYLDCFDMDLNEHVDQVLAWGERYEYLGESLPCYYLEYGPDSFAAFLGAELILAEDRSTSWPVPFVDDWDSVDFTFQRNGYWWQRSLEAFAILRERCADKLLIIPPTLCSNLDVLSAIRGPEKLMMDLVLEPEKVKRALEQVRRAHTEVMEAYAVECEWHRYGSMNIEGCYCEGRQSRPQSDASCMISAGMFREFVVPCLESEGNDADAFVYHLDGPQALQHIDALCNIKKLDMIAWVPGAGNEDKDWKAVYDKIDRLGKGQWRYYATSEQIKSAWQNYSSRKLSFYTSVSSRGEAEDLIGMLEEVEKNS